jgi:predicted outer membrane repeat protein
MEETRRPTRARMRALAALAILASVAPAAGAEVLLVPGAYATLQQAIDAAGEGDVIELAAGTYPAPSGGAGTQGFRIHDKQVDFTIRAASGASVVLDGQNARAVLRLQNTSLALAGHVTVEGIIIRNGRSSVMGLTAGVTMQRARARFRDCRFENNQTVQYDSGGGGVQVSVGSEAEFERSTWSDNGTSFYGGGLSIQEHSTVTIRDSLFERNTVNPSGHQPSASGGAIHVGNSTLLVERTRFVDNEAGYAGGALYAIGLWDDAQGSAVTVRNSSFVSNRAERHPTVSYEYPTEGGAVHVENLVDLRIHDSRFLENEAHDGGGVNAYRADVEIYHTAFRGNRASGGAATSTKSIGGQISVISNDTSDDDAVNRRAVRLHLEDSLLQGRYGATTTAADVGGCLLAAGDTNRMFGQNGVEQGGDLASNRAGVVVRGVVFDDCDVAQHAVGGSGVGGALAVDLADLTLEDSLVLRSDAIGSGTDNSSGGGAAVLSHSRATIARTTFAENSAGAYGGALFVQGAEIAVSDAVFARNELSPGVAESCWPSSTGAAIFAAPFEAGGGRSARDVTGTVASSIFTGNVGLAIFDDDRSQGPINDVRYDDNVFHSSSFGGAVYTSVIPNSVPPFSVCVPASALTPLVLQRQNGSSTDKSSVDNADSGQPLVTAALRAAPSRPPGALAPADGAQPLTAPVWWAWSGAAAALNAAPLGDEIGSQDLAPGLHELVVDGGEAAALASVPEPGAALAGAGALAALLLRRAQMRSTTARS